VVGGIVALAGGSELLVRGATSIARAAGVSEVDEFTTYTLPSGARAASLTPNS
jgi:hypothetical protein